MSYGYYPSSGGGGAGTQSGNPYLDYASAALQTAGSVFGGGDGQQESHADRNRFLNPNQMAAIIAMLQEQYFGGGDILGPYLREGQGSLSQMLASRGIRQGSGVAANAMSNMTSNAVATASQKRLENILALSQARPPMIQGELYDTVPPPGYRFDVAGVVPRLPGEGRWGPGDRNPGSLGDFQGSQPPTKRRSPWPNRY